MSGDNKICIVSTCAGRYDIRVYVKEACTLAKHGYRVELLCADGKTDEYINGVNIRSLTDHKLSKKERLKLLFCQSDFCKSILETEADIYQLHDLELFFLGLKLRRRSKKVIFDLYENWEGYVGEISWIPKIFRKLVSKSLTLCYKLFLNKFNAVLTVSPNMLENLKQYADNVVLLPNYPIIDDRKDTLDSERRDEFIYAGTVYSFSQQDLIVNSLELLPEHVKYNMVGRISDTYKERLEKLKGWSHVNFPGWITKEELDDMYRRSLAGIIVFDYSPVCCYEEGQMGSNKIFEYMQAGLPVICTDFKLWKELIIDKYKCGICVDPHDSNAIYLAMKYMLENKEEAIEMGKRGRKAVEEEFNWNVGEEDFIKLYRNLK